MNEDQLKKGNAILKEIEELKGQLNDWNDSDKIYDLELQGTRNNAGFRRSVRTSFVDFEVLKTLSVSKIREQLSEKEKEFQKM